MVSLLGTRDELLKLIEAAFEGTVFVRGNEITITGEQADAERVAHLFEELITLLERGDALTADTVGPLHRHHPRRRRRPPALGGLRRLGPDQPRPLHQAKTVGQKKYVDAIRKNTVVFGIGPAGTGKTYLAMAVAVQALMAKQVNRLILTRPAVRPARSSASSPAPSRRRSTPTCAPLRRPLRDDRRRADRPHDGTRHHRGGPLAYMRGRTLGARSSCSTRRRTPRRSR